MLFLQGQTANTNAYVDRQLCAACHPEPCRKGRAQRPVALDFGIARVHAALLLAAKGDRAAAEQHLRQAAASSDPNVRRQAADALRQLGPRQ